jgi:hypothetical protein
MSKLEGAEEAAKIIEANKSPRYRSLERWELWAKGKQYEGRQSWWDDSGNVPLWEREPCIVYPIVSIAAESNVDLVFGEGRFPTFTAGAEDDSEEEGGLNPDQTQDVDRFVRDYQRLSRFRTYCREGFRQGQAVGTVCGLHGIRADKPFSEILPAKWCTPKLGLEGEVLSLEIKYPYSETTKQPDGSWKVKAMLYRRTFDAVSDVTYLPAAAREDGKEPSWTPDPSRSVQHNLGFCPVVWYAFRQGCPAAHVIDGHPIHELLLGEIQSHDIALSQRHRGALLSEPQLWETGVQPGYNPTEPGQTARVPSTLQGGEINNDNLPNGSYVDGAPSKPARKKGPGYVWQYANHETKVGAVFYPGDSLESQDNNARDLRIKLQEALSVVFLDPEHLKLANQASGKALEAIKQRQLDRCDQYREELEDRFIAPSVEMQLKIAKAKEPKRVKSLKKALPLMKDDLEIRTVWGPYSKPDATEEKGIVELVRAALGDGTEEPLITPEIAIRRIAPIFGIKDAKAVLDELTKLKEERMQQAHELAAEAENDESRAGSSGAEKPPAAA